MQRGESLLGGDTCLLLCSTRLKVPEWLLAPQSFENGEKCFLHFSQDARYQEKQFSPE